MMATLGLGERGGLSPSRSHPEAGVSCEVLLDSRAEPPLDGQIDRRVGGNLNFPDLVRHAKHETASGRR